MTKSTTPSRRDERLDVLRRWHAALTKRATQAKALVAQIDSEIDAVEDEIKSLMLTPRSR